MPNEWYPGSYQQSNVKLFSLKAVISTPFWGVFRCLKKCHIMLQNNTILVEHMNTIVCVEHGDGESSHHVTAPEWEIIGWTADMLDAPFPIRTPPEHNCQRPQAFWDLACRWLFLLLWKNLTPPLPPIPDIFPISLANETHLWCIYLWPPFCLSLCSSLWFPKCF